MSAISTLLTRLQNTLSTLRAAIWAIDVRDDIADAIEECGQMVEQCYSDVSNPTLKTEALEAALQNKIDQGEMAALTIGDRTITAVKLANGVIPAADATLTTSGGYADAAETGRQIGNIKADLDALEGNTLSTGARNALINFLDKVTVTDSEGNALLETLKLAMLGDLVAVYEQTAIVDMGTNLDTLKTNLSVKAVRSDGTIADVDEYELSGNLGEEISDITVTTNRASAVFKVLCAPSGRWVNNTLTISSNELAQGSYNGTPPEYTNGSMARLLYKGAKIDFDKRYRYTVSINSSKTVNVAVRGMKKSAFDIYKNKESFDGRDASTDTGWQSNGYIFNSDGSADDELAFLWIPIKRTDNETILLSDVTSIIVTRALR